jgi:hypothetical protein
MSTSELVILRKKAENAVADMTEGPLKVKAFEVILTSLLSGPSSGDESEPDPPARPVQPIRPNAPSSLAERVNLIADEGFFSEPRSLSEIQNKLAEHGWHYPQTSLSTPLIRLVRQRVLRRLQVAEGNKKVWKYSLP